MLSQTEIQEVQSLRKQLERGLVDVPLIKNFLVRLEGRMAPKKENDRINSAMEYLSKGTRKRKNNRQR